MARRGVEGQVPPGRPAERGRPARSRTLRAAVLGPVAFLAATTGFRLLATPAYAIHDEPVTTNSVPDTTTDTTTPSIDTTSTSVDPATTTSVDPTGTTIPEGPGEGGTSTTVDDGEAGAPPTTAGRAGGTGTTVVVAAAAGAAGGESAAGPAPGGRPLASGADERLGDLSGVAAAVGPSRAAAAVSRVSGPLGGPFRPSRGPGPDVAAVVAGLALLLVAGGSVVVVATEDRRG